MRMLPLKPLILTAAMAAGLIGVAAAGAASPAATPSDPTPPPAAASAFRQPIHLAQLTEGPVLSAIEGAALVAPGGLVKVDGANFGAARGSLCLRWNTIVVVNTFTRTGRLCLDIIDWQPSRVIASVPDDVIGVPDQTAQLELTRADGEQANTLNISFVATRETLELSSTNLNGHSTVIYCSQNGADENQCTSEGGYHANGYCCSTEDAVGSLDIDTFRLSFANGWKISDVKLHVIDGTVSISRRPAAGSASGTLRVFWSAGGFGGAADYRLHVTVTGPKGVPLA